jgi:diguanylate cyclase (GGDEF)-like protein/PAS domain S-box-containing protein
MTRILVVDDDAQSRYLLEVLLKGNGFQVVSAENGAEALEAARREPPELIVSDILMPVMDGYTLCRHWRADERLKAIPFVFYTANYTDAKDQTLGLGLGAAQVIIKPEQPDILLQRLKQALQPYGGEESFIPPKPEPQYLKEYSEVLFHKLEQKMAEVGKANASLRSLIDAAPFGIMTIGEGFRIRSWNKAAEEIFGWTEAEVLNKPIPFFDQPALAECQVVLSRIQAGEKKINIERRNPTKSGEWIHLRLCMSPMSGRERGVGRVVAIAEDVTHLRQADEALRLLERAIESVTNGVAVVEVSREGFPVIYANKAFASLTGSERGEIIDQPLVRLHQQLGVSPMLLSLEVALREARDARIRSPLHRRDGSVLWGNLAVSYVRDEDAGAAHAVLSLDDVSDQIDTKERIRYGAYHDRLTGLANASLIYEQLDRAIRDARGGARMVGALMLNLGRFAAINEEYGEEAGKRLLRIVSHRLVSCVHEVDRVARLGGDEFGVALPDLRSHREVEDMVATVLGALSPPIDIGGATVKIDARLGTGVYPADGQDAAALLKRAESVMRAAKPGGH